jgi:hypothetical protein
MGSVIESWNKQRIFFTDTYGNTHLVDITKTLYEIKLWEDDGAFDFDLIASSVKSNLRTVFCYDDTTTPSETDDTGNRISF